MCGIVARFRDSAFESDGFLERALALIAHRGPDGEGVLRPSPKVELGHRRLAIISPRDGQQPVRDEETGVSLTYNGEIYNYRALRDILVGKGHRFHTQCDTEVLLRGYLEYGTGVLEHIEGMFAFVLFDPRSDLIFGARDRIGIKPLYYFVGKDRAIWASEIKAILADDSVPRRIEAGALHEYLVFGYAAGPATMFSSIQELEPGFSFQFRHGRLELKRYWEARELTPFVEDEEQALELVDKALEEAVSSTLISDVPLAVTVSGGVDSSLVSHYAHKKAPGLTLYTLRHLEENYDETRYARMVAEPRGMRLKIIDISSHEAADLLEAVIWHYDEPIIQTNTIGLYQLCREIHRDGIKVLLCGEGADELFGGYDRYRETRDEILRGGRDRVLYGRNEVAFPRIETFWPGQPKSFPYREELQSRVAEARVENSVLLYDQVTYLVHLLQRADRMGMACGIEIRVPFLERAVVEAANALAPSLKVGAHESKYLLKRLASRYLPHELIYRPKQAFDTPIGQSLASGAFNRYFKELVGTESRVAGLFDLRGIQGLMARLEAGETPLWRMLWQLLTLEVWMRKFDVRG